MTRLTVRSIEALRPKADRYEVWDEARRGFGVRVTPRGVKSFVWLYHFEGRSRRLTLGTHPSLSLAEAGVKLAEAQSQLTKGIDPGSRVVAKRRAERNAETVAELVASYLDRYARIRKRSAFEDERILKKDVLSRWGYRQAKDITRRDIVQLLNEIVDRGAPIQANRTLTILRRTFKFAVGQAILEVSPCDMVEAPSSENVRDRVLAEDEVRLLWNVLKSAPMELNARRILRMMLVTGQRKGEIIGLHKQEIDHQKRLWTLPATRAKNGREHLIPLSTLALGILTESGPNEAGYLFPSRITGAPYRGQSIDHAARYLFDPRPTSWPKKRPLRSISVPPLAGIMERFTPHDLRRTVATRMRELGISRGDVKMVLNHVETDVTARYDHYDGLAEKQRALDIWAKRLIEIIDEEMVT
ncbi:MAG: tyrosine-type recombinase/integrase [Stellaceae bacterium]